MKNLLLAGALAALVSGCATYYEEVAEDVPHANITFQRNVEGVKARKGEPLQDYNLIDNPQCDNQQGIATFSFDSEFIKTARFPADRKLHFYMHSVPGGDIYNQWCWSYLGFDAENGRDYVVMHQDCSPVVYDKTDGDWVQVEDIDVIDGFECPKS